MGNLTDSPGPVRVFVSYAQEDQEFADELLKHLCSLRREGVVLELYGGPSDPGVDWLREAEGKLDSADVILVLLSPDYLASERRYELLVSAVMRAEAGEARVVPVLLRPVDWQHGPLARFQALPSNGQPVTQSHNRDEALCDVAKGVRAVVAAARQTGDTEALKPRVLDMLRKRRSMAVLELASISDLDVEDVQLAVRELQDAGLVRISNQDNILDEVVTATRRAL